MPKYKDYKKFLSCRWDKKQNNLIFTGPYTDGGLLQGLLCHVMINDQTFVEALEDRGYDITSIRFEVKRRFSKIIGMTFNDARKYCKVKGYKLRASHVDGISTIGTRDYNKNRLNVEVESGIVMTAGRLG